MTRPRYARDRVPPTALAIASLQPAYDPNFQPYLNIAPGSVQLMTQAPVGIVSGMGDATTDEQVTASSANPYDYPQCTWGVWNYVKAKFNVSIPRFAGNATDWVDAAKRRNWKILQFPTENTIACWSSGVYPPYGHVAWVTKVSEVPHATKPEERASFTVDEWNFKRGQHGVRTILIGSDEAKVQGFIQVPGVTVGASTNPGEPALNAATDAWNSFNSGIAEVSKQMQQQVNTLANKTFAGAQIGAGMAVLAGAGVFTIMALKSPAGAQAAVRGAAGMPRQLAGRANRTVVPVAQDAVLGPKPPDLSPTGRVPRARAARTLPR